jgi:hypothetical protein
MFRFGPGLMCALLLLAPSLSFAQPTSTNPPPAPAAKLLGASFVKVPELLYVHLPNLPKGQGLVVATVAQNSVASRIGLHRNDILLRFEATPVKSTKELADLLLTTPPGLKTELLIVRDGKSQTLPCVLQKEDLPQSPHTEVKREGPEEVNLRGKPLDHGKFQVTLTYYARGSKQQSLTCTGTPEQIEAEIRQMTRQQQVSSDVRDLVEVALARFRQLKMPN